MKIKRVNHIQKQAVLLLLVPQVKSLKKKKSIKSKYSVNLCRSFKCGVLFEERGSQEK